MHPSCLDITQKCWACNRSFDQTLPWVCEENQTKIWESYEKSQLINIASDRSQHWTPPEWFQYRLQWQESLWRSFLSSRCHISILQIILDVSTKKLLWKYFHCLVLARNEGTFKQTSMRAYRHRLYCITSLRYDELLGLQWQHISRTSSACFHLFYLSTVLPITQMRRQDPNKNWQAGRLYTLFIFNENSKIFHYHLLPFSKWSKDWMFKTTTVTGIISFPRVVKCLKDTEKAGHSDLEACYTEEIFGEKMMHPNIVPRV